MRPQPALRVVISILALYSGLALASRWLAPPDAQGSLAYQTGYRQAAAQHYTDAAVRDPLRPERHFSAGSAQIALDDAEAAALLERAFDGVTDPVLRRDAAYNAGIAYYRLDDFHAAVAAFQQALILDPDDSDARYNYELALRYALPPTPSEQQQRTQPEEGETDPTVTPTPEPGGFDGPTPTPPREEQEPDPTQTPTGGTGDFGDDADSTPVSAEHGSMTLEEALRLLDAVAQDTASLAPFYATPSVDGEPGENDW